MSARPPHLLLVDDEPVILQILRAVFAGEEVRLSACADGASAAALIERDPVDLLITDKNLPDLSGIELMQIGRAHV